LVSVNDRFIKCYSEGQAILQEEIHSLRSKDKLKLRILMGKSPPEAAETALEFDSKILEETLQQKNSLYYATNFYSLAQDTHLKRHYPLSLQYVQKAYQLASAARSNAGALLPVSASSLSCGPASSLPLIRLEKLMACCRELQGSNYLCLGQDIQAIEFFQDAIAIRKRVYQTDFHLSIYKAVDTLSRIYRRHSIFSQSLLYAQLLLDLCRHNHRLHSSQMANALSNLAKIKRAQLLLNDSFLLEIEAFQLRVAVHGYEHEAIGISLLAIGGIKQALGDLGHGTEEIYQKAVHIYQQIIVRSSSSTSSGHSLKRRNSSPSTPAALATACHQHLGDVYSALSSLERERKNRQQAEEYKLREVEARQRSKLMTRALLEAYWDLGQLMEGKEAAKGARAMEASEYRLKAIDGMRRMYGEKNKRMVKMVREHEKRSKKTPDEP
jgi:hypothetical protein